MTQKRLPLPLVRIAGKCGDPKCACYGQWSYTRPLAYPAALAYYARLRRLAGPWAEIDIVPDLRSIRQLLAASPERRIPSPADSPPATAPSHPPVAEAACAEPAPPKVLAALQSAVKDACRDLDVELELVQAEVVLVPQCAAGTPAADAPPPIVTWLGQIGGIVWGFLARLPWPLK